MQSHWIFSLMQGVRPEYRKPFTNALASALDAWQTHGKTVAYEVELRENQFVFVQALSPASGCAIDWMKQAIENVAERFETEIADAAEVFYETEAGVQHVHFAEIEDAIQRGDIGANTTILDHTVVNHNDFDQWRKPLKDSWLARFLPVTA